MKPAEHRWVGNYVVQLLSVLLVGYFTRVQAEYELKPIDEGPMASFFDSATDISRLTSMDIQFGSNCFRSHGRPVDLCIDLSDRLNF